MMAITFCLAVTLYTMAYYVVCSDGVSHHTNWKQPALFSLTRALNELEQLLPPRVRTDTIFNGSIEATFITAFAKMCFPKSSPPRYESTSGSFLGNEWGIGKQHGSRRRKTSFFSWFSLSGGFKVVLTLLWLEVNQGSGKKWAEC